jgi:hypothetical protein
MAFASVNATRAFLFREKILGGRARRSFNVLVDFESAAVMVADVLQNNSRQLCKSCSLPRYPRHDLPLDVHNALQRSAITSGFATLVDVPVSNEPAKAAGNRTVSDVPMTSSADDTETLWGRFCGEKTRGVFGSICSWILKGFGSVGDEMFGECEEPIK